ncbi:MAG: lytic transglycosylase domain-containing protein [Myxococcota bacterium]
MRLAWILSLLLSASVARADIFSFTDANGVVHFTNVARPRGWTRVMRTGPGKAAAVRGCKSCDVVPARDSSKDRYLRYDAHVKEAASLYQIPVALVRAVIKAESDFDPRVVSSAGAQGLMQLMPDVQSEMNVRDVFDPRDNVFGGTRLLRVLANRFEGDLMRTIAGYHAGPGAVEKYDGVPPYETTQKYLRAVLANYYRYKTRFP